MIIHAAASKAGFHAEKMGKITLCGGDFLFAGLNCFEPGQQHEPHLHADQDKIYLVMEGAGVATVAETQAVVHAGDLIFAPAGALHSMRNPGPGRLVVMTVLGPPPKK